MRVLLLLSLVLVASASPAQNNSKTETANDVKRCAPKIVKQGTAPTGKFVRLKGEKATGYSPEVTFEILESGDVTNVRLKRSCGFKSLDDRALNWIRSTKYNRRPGCGVIESEMTMVHYY